MQKDLMKRVVVDFLKNNKVTISNSDYKKIDHLIGAKYYKDPYYLFKYYRALTAEGDDAITWGEALDVDVWCNYYINSLIEHQFAEKIDEIKDLMLSLRRCYDVF